MVYRIVLCFLTMVLFHILRTHGGQPAPLGVSPQAALGPGAPFALLFPDLGVCRAVSRSSLQAAIVLQFFFFSLNLFSQRPNQCFYWLSSGQL